MVSEQRFRTICLTIGFLFMILVIVSHASKLGKGIGITFSILLMALGVISTTKLRQKLTGGEDVEGSMGKPE